MTSRVVQLALPLGVVPWLCAVPLRRPVRRGLAKKPKPVEGQLFQAEASNDVARAQEHDLVQEPTRPAFVGRHHSLPIRKSTPKWLAETLTDDDRLALRVLRPRTRGECVDGPRPCPWISCRHHTYLEVAPDTGSLMLPHRDKWPWELEQTCSLDVADAAAEERKPTKLRVVGEYLGISKERVRQLEVRLKVQLRAMADHDPARDGMDDDDEDE